MKTLILSISLAILAISSAGCTVVADHPHRHYYYAEPEVIVVGPPPPPGPAVIIVPGPPGPRYYGPPFRDHWRR
jgi:hypothetical protein